MIPKPASSHSLIQWLANSKAAQKLFVGCGLLNLTNLLLEKFPLHRRLPKMGISYRMRRIESLIVEDEIFRSKVYQTAITPEIRTIMDIGCNVGFFPLYCADELGRKDLEGIAIDANPEVAEEAAWHLRTNGLTQIDVLHGLAGAPQDEKEGTFYVSASNIASSVRSTPNPNLPGKGELKAIQVRAIDLAAEWKGRHGQKRIDLLKIDVEGSEKELIQNSRELLALADAISIDIHKWAVSVHEIVDLLGQNGFECIAEEGDNAHAVVGFFVRKKADTSEK